MTANDNKTLVQRWFDEYLNTGDRNAVERLATPDFEFHFLGSDENTGSQGVQQQLGMMRSAFPDLHYTLENVITEGSQCAARFTIEGTHQQEFLGLPASGKHFKIRGISIFEISSGKISKVTPTFDRIGMLQQLGGQIPGRAAA